MSIVKYKLVRRSQYRSEVGPYEEIEFLATDSNGQDVVLFAHMESDNLDSLDLGDEELEREFQTFLDSNFDLLHYYMT